MAVSLREEALIPTRRQHRNYTCGASCVQAVLAAYGVPDTEADLAQQLGSDPETGTPPANIIAYLERCGFPVEARDGMSLEDLRAETDAGRPVLACAQFYGGGHWVTVCDVDDQAVTVMDPVKGHRRLSLANWEQRWYDQDGQGKPYVRYGISVGPPQRAAVESRDASGHEHGQDGRFASGSGGGEKPHPATQRKAEKDAASHNAIHGKTVATLGIRRAVESRLHEALEATPMAPLPPESALAYFLRLVPKLGIDPERWGEDLRRRTFTLAKATTLEIVSRVQQAIADRLASGEVSSGPAAIDAILDAAGCGPTQRGYSENVWRTNAMDSFAQGLQDELDQAQETFPVWKYSNPSDSRSRPEHAARNGNFYPSSVPFTAVRGTEAKDVCQCRCVAVPIYKGEWTRLKAAGARLADGYSEVS